MSAWSVPVINFFPKNSFLPLGGSDDPGLEGPCPVSPDGILMRLQMPASVVSLETMNCLKMNVLYRFYTTFLENLNLKTRK